MPEEFLWILVGILGMCGMTEMALYLVALFEVYMRPSELLMLYCDDLVPPANMSSYPCYTIVLAPIEREKSTTTGHYDQTVLLDGDI